MRFSWWVFWCCGLGPSPSVKLEHHGPALCFMAKWRGGHEVCVRHHGCGRPWSYLAKLQVVRWVDAFGDQEIHRFTCCKVPAPLWVSPTTGGNTPPGRYGHTAVMDLDGKMWIFGGASIGNTDGSSLSPHKIQCCNANGQDTSFDHCMPQTSKPVKNTNIHKPFHELNSLVTMAFWCLLSLSERVLCQATGLRCSLLPPRNHGFPDVRWKQHVPNASKCLSVLSVQMHMVFQGYSNDVCCLDTQVP